ncbi:uncharacterized protein LOC124682670 [Lolium rigidum]|uniref:uncharacterized protein LOC124682670 n=1 Tax=Lolium rigidum TaxID=89674 RepID=UPI001F5C5DC5|nr:uncharacterized protein LOC124682670 [Lolium rigidum]
MIEIRSRRSTAATKLDNETRTRTRGGRSFAVLRHLQPELAAARNHEDPCRGRELHREKLHLAVIFIESYDHHVTAIFLVATLLRSSRHFPELGTVGRLPSRTWEFESRTAGDRRGTSVWPPRCTRLAERRLRERRHRPCTSRRHRLHEHRLYLLPLNTKVEERCARIAGLHSMSLWR